jgi:hypothetical protein
VTAGPPRRHRLVLAASTLALAALHLWVAREVTLPDRGPGDQWGYLGSARFLAGDPHTYVLPQFPYFSYGYSLVLAPLTRALHDPHDLFLAIKVVNAALAASLLPLLYLLGRRLLDASRAHALAGAWVGSLVPAVVVRPSSILAENLALPLVVATVLSVWLLLSVRPAWQRLLAAPSVVWLHLTHPRFTLVLLTFAGVLLAAAWGRLVPRWIVVANGAVAVVLLAGSQVLRDAIVAARWTFGIATIGPTSDAPELLTDRRFLGELLLEAVGQAWYVGVTTLGLAALGVWAMARRAGQRSAAASEGPRLLVGRDDPRTLAAAFALASAALVFATSCYFFTRVMSGSEGFVAGRHNDSFVPMWAAAGTVFALSTPISSLRRAAWSLTAIVAALTALLRWQRDAAELGSYYTMLNVPGLAHHGVVGVHVFHRAALIGLGALLVVSLLAALGKRPTVLLPVAALWLLVVVAADVQPSPVHDGWETPAQFRRLGVDRVAAIQSRAASMPVYYPYFLPQVHFTPWDGTGTPPERVVVAPLDAPLARLGARVALVDEPVRIGLRPVHAMAVWVLPGPEQDALAAEGALLPGGFPTALPPAARSVDLEVRGGAVVRVRAGASAEIAVRGRHTGAGAPWPDEGSAGDAATVRVVARLAPDSAGGRPVVGAAELPAWIRPGDRFSVELALAAVDDGEPLEPGRYEVTVDLEQRGFGSFAPAGSAPLRVVLEVTG